MSAAGAWAGEPVRFGFVKYNSTGLEEFCPLVEQLGGSLLTFADGSTLFHDPYVCAAVAAVTFPRGCAWARW